MDAHWTGDVSAEGPLPLVRNATVTVVSVFTCSGHTQKNSRMEYMPLSGFFEAKSHVS